jgi:hypothetical protein
MRKLMIIASAASAGCSFTTRSVDRAWTVRDGPPECTDSYALPVLDGLGAGVLTGASFALIDNDQEGAAIGAFAVALTYGIASVIGEQRVAHCRQAELVYAGGG